MHDAWQAPTEPAREARPVDEDAPTIGWLIDVWFAPREVARKARAAPGEYGVLALAALEGIGMSWPHDPTWIERSAGFGLLQLPVAVACLVGFGTLGGLLWMLLRAGLVWLALTLIGVRCSGRDVRLAFAWGLVPWIAAELLLGWTSAVPLGPVASLCAFAVFGCSVLAYGWSLAIRTAALAETCRTSLLVAFGAQLLEVALGCGGFFAVVMLIAFGSW